MKRAAVIIGVNQVGNLPRLHAAVTNVKQINEWATSQKFASIVNITDEVEEVTIKRIKKEIKRLVKDGSFEQLIVYFSGHGVNLAHSEYWLLTGAPEDPNEAVNVEGSVRLARQSVFPHVVFISDACRTAAEGIQAQAVEGSTIFPSQPSQGPEKKIDLFFATIVGNPAYEVKDPDKATAQYKAIYTDALRKGLSGAAPDCLEPVNENGAAIDLVRPWPLKDYLDKEVPRGIAAAGLPISVFQVPDARITSPPATWLSRIIRPPGAVPLPEELAVSRTPSTTAALTKAAIVPQQQLQLFQSGVGMRPETAFLARRITMLEHAVGPTLAESAEQIIAKEAEERSKLAEEGAPPMVLETLSGFLVRGATVVEAYHPNAASSPFFLPRGGERLKQLFSRRRGLAFWNCENSLFVFRQDSSGATSFPPTELVGGASPFTLMKPTNETWLPLTKPVSVVLRFDNGKCTILPVIPSFYTALTFDGQNLVDVTFFPSPGTSRWDLDRILEMRGFRGRIAATARFGLFRPEGKEASKVAQEIQYATSLDPTMAVYAAYAYDCLQENERIHQMDSFLFNDQQLRLFDVALLAGRLNGRDPGKIEELFPPVPMLSQGWALLSAHNVRQRGPTSMRFWRQPWLKSIRRYLEPSVWTLFASRGIDQLKSALKSGIIH